eukprot:6492310-Amphidinium_carterae.2
MSWMRTGPGEIGNRRLSSKACCISCSCRSIARCSSSCRLRSSSASSPSSLCASIAVPGRDTAPGGNCCGGCAGLAPLPDAGPPVTLARPLHILIVTSSARQSPTS